MHFTREYFGYRLVLRQFIAEKLWRQAAGDSLDAADPQALSQQIFSEMRVSLMQRHGPPLGWLPPLQRYRRA